MENFQLAILVSLPLFLVLTQVAIVVYLIRILEKLDKHKNDPNAAMAEAAMESNEMIHDASKQANELLVSAELKSIEVMSQQKVVGQDAIEKLKEHIGAIRQSLEKQFDITASGASDAYEKFIEDTEKKIQEYLISSNKKLEDKGTEMVDQNLKLMNKVTQEIQDLVKKHVEGEMQVAHDEIEAYKGKRLRVLDERIIDVLEEVLRLTLEKKLTLADQSDMIYKALEQAKKDNALR